MNQDSRRLYRLSTGHPSGTLSYLILFFAFLSLGGANPEQEIGQTVSNFFDCINQQKYDRAYGYFSDAIKQELSYSKFKEKASSIKKTRIVKLAIYDRDKFLAKLEIKVKIHLYYRERYFEALYGGTCDLNYDNKKWKLISVNLKALEQKEILSKKPINFGKE